MKFLQNISCKAQIAFGTYLEKAKLRLKDLKILFVFRKMTLISNFGISFCIKGSYQHLHPFYDFQFKRKSLKNITLSFLFQCIKCFKMRENQKKTLTKTQSCDVVKCLIKITIKLNNIYKETTYNKYFRK